MCGISGILYFDQKRQVPRQLIEQMNLVLHHRGPDDTGVWVKDNIGLGQARLSIIDLSPQGRQPMCNEDGTIWITYNGEIYNFLELRIQLEARGHRFHSHADTEVMLHLWEEKGPRMLEDLRGMFAIALWDDREKTLFLARDRIGKKPLFYAHLNDRIVFGSEIKAILQDPEFIPEPDYEAIHLYLAYQSVPAPYCAFKGIRKLPPAHYLLVKNGHSELKRYWQLSYQDKLKIETETELKDLEAEIIDRLREAIKLRLISEVPLGAFLSGGIDSSIIVALMAELMNQPVKTFSIGFENEEYNELAYARLVADRYQTEHHEFIVTPDAKAIIPDLVWHYNEPFADSSAIPTYYVSKLARQYVTVVLTGDAGDENFAGYPRYKFTGDNTPFYGSQYPRVYQRFLDPAADSRLKPFLSKGKFKIEDRLRAVALKRNRLFYYYRITHFNESLQADLYSDGFKTQTSGIFPVDITLRRFAECDSKDFLDSLLFLDMNLYLPDTLMTKTDIAGMANSLEARMPLLDHKFVEFVARIPSNLKLKDGTMSKFVFKKAVEPYLPEEVIYRKKMGFGVPLDHWFRHELKDLAYDTLLGEKAIGRGYFQRDSVKSILDRHQAGDVFQYRIWNLLMLEFWHQMFIDKKPRAT